MLITNLEDIRQYQGNIAPELYTHPQFIRELDHAIRWYKKECGPVPLNIEFLEDGKKIVISHQFVSLGASRDNYTNNNERLRFQFSVDKNGSLSVETSLAICYDKNQYIDLQSNDLVNGALVPNNDKRAKLERICAEYSSFLDIYYRNKYYDVSGIQLADTLFNNKQYPLVGHQFDDDLGEILSSELYKPIEWSYNLGPKIPLKVSNASFVHAYRYLDELGLIHKIQREGIKDVSDCNHIDNTNDTWEMYIGDRPECMFDITGYTIAHQNKNVAKQFEYCGIEQFAGMSESEIRTRVAEKFLALVDSSITCEQNPVMYDKLRKFAIATVKKYNPEFVDANSYQR